MSATIHSRRANRRTESIVDVDHHNSRRTAGDHRHQRGKATETDAVANTRWHRHHWRRYEAGNRARQGAFEAGDRNDHFTLSELLCRGHQALESGNADVVPAPDFMAKKFESDGRFVGNREIAGTSTDHGNRASPGLARNLRWQDDCASTGMVYRPGVSGTNGESLRFVDARGEGTAAARGKRAKHR